jgi:plastocyanin
VRPDSPADASTGAGTVSGMLFLRRALPAVVVLALVVSCSNRESPTNKRPHAGTATASPVDGVQEIVMTSGVDLRFHPSTLIVHPGKVRIVLENTSKAGAGPPHNAIFTGLPVANVPLAQAGRSESTTFMAPAPGTYNFVCSIHAAQGQTGKLIVK